MSEGCNFCGSQSSAADEFHSMRKRLLESVTPLEALCCRALRYFDALPLGSLGQICRKV